jgi:hypothetical protein
MATCNLHNAHNALDLYALASILRTCRLERTPSCTRQTNSAGAVCQDERNLNHHRSGQSMVGNEPSLEEAVVCVILTSASCCELLVKTLAQHRQSGNELCPIVRSPTPQQALSFPLGYRAHLQVIGQVRCKRLCTLSLVLQSMHGMNTEAYGSPRSHNVRKQLAHSRQCRTRSPTQLWLAAAWLLMAERVGLEGTPASSTQQL